MGAVSSDLGLKKDRSDETNGTKRIYIEAFVGVTISCLYHHSTIQDHHSTIQDHYSTIISVIESTITRTISTHITSPSPHHHKTTPPCQNISTSNVRFVLWHTNLTIKLTSSPTPLGGAGPRAGRLSAYCPGPA
jgi:hypothetical protein